MNQEIIVYPEDGILPSSKKEYKVLIQAMMDGSQNNYAEWKKADKKSPTLQFHLYEILDNAKWSIAIETSLVVTGGRMDYKDVKKLLVVVNLFLISDCGNGIMGLCIC